MSKKVVNTKSSVQLVIPAGKAMPAPPVATALGPRGVNLMEFCRAFNEKTSAMVEASKDHLPEMRIDNTTPVKALVTIHENKKIDVEIKGVPTTHYLKRYAGITQGGTAAKREPYKGKVTRSQCEEIAKANLVYMNTENVTEATKMIVGTAASMNIQVVEE